VNGVYEVRHVRNPVLEAGNRPPPASPWGASSRASSRRIARVRARPFRGVLATYPLRGKQPLVCPGGRHTDVGDDHVRRLAPHELQLCSAEILSHDSRSVCGLSPGRESAFTASR
jgi:hypothetical protein